MAMPVSMPYSVLHFAMTVSSDGRVRARLEGWVRETNAARMMIKRETVFIRNGAVDLNLKHKATTKSDSIIAP